MSSLRIRTAAALCFGVTVFLGAVYVQAEPADQSLRTALDELHRWLDAGQHSQRWRKYLRSEKLEAELAKGAKADPAVVSEVLGQYASGDSEVQGRRFVEVRRALGDWLAELVAPSFDRLPAACRTAKGVFVPRTDADLANAKSELVAAVARLDARLKAAGPGGDNWKAYLKWDEMQAQLSGETGEDLGGLDAIYARYASGNDGLELVWFVDVREALRQYLQTARAIDNAGVETQYATLLDGLADHLKTCARPPTPDQVLVIDTAIRWLEAAGQAPWLVQAIRHHFAEPNFLARVSAEVVGAGIAGPVDQTEPVRDVILGTNIQGTGHTTGNITVELVPADQRAEIKIVAQTTTESQTIGHNGPARIHSTGTTQITTRKSILIDAERIRALPAGSQAVTNSTVTAIRSARGGGVVERAAQNRVYQRKPEADRIAARHAEQRANRRADQEAGQVIDEANATLVKKVRQPLVQRGLFPEMLRFNTTETALHVTAFQGGAAQLGAAVPPPKLPETPDLAVRVHESMIHHLADGAFAGMTLEEERLLDVITQLVGPLPEELQPEDDGERWGITFARQQPISVRFADGRLRLTIRGRKYTRGDNSYPGMNVTATYKIQKAGRGFKLVRQGELEILPPGFTPDSGGQLSVRQQVIRNLLQRRFGKIFTKESVAEPLELPGKWSQAGKFALAQWEAADGWLVMAWKKVPSAD